MGDLFWNKIAGAVLATFLVIFAINEAGHVVFHAHELEEAAYPIEINTDGGAGAPVEEGPPDFGALLAEATVDAGERIFRQCATCHNIAEGAGALTGPNLWDIVGAPVAGQSGFAYSQALREFGGEWTYEHLYAYLENPRRYIRGTNMAFAGLSRQEQRISVIAYLREQSSDPEPLPPPLAAMEAASAAAEDAAAAVAEPASAASEPAPDSIDPAVSDDGGDQFGGAPAENAEPAVDGATAPDPTGEADAPADSEPDVDAEGDPPGR